MSNPAAYRFSESHEWAHAEGDVVTIGLTQHAVDELTDVTFVEMNRVGAKATQGGSVGEVESVKATSDVYSPVDGEIIEVNQSLADDPSVLNSDPYGAGWLLRIRTSDTSPLNSLMDAETYRSKYPS